MDKVKVEQLIVCTKKRRGDGKRLHSPIRVITEVCDFDGNLIAESDPCGDLTPESLLDFLNHHYSSMSEDFHIEKINAYFIDLD